MGAEFQQDSSLTLDMMKAWTIERRETAAEQLCPEWTGDEIGLVALNLNGDNRTVNNAQFLLQGTMFRNAVKVVNANQFWTFPGNTPHQLVLEPIDCSIFKFRDSLVSNLVDDSEIEFSLRPTGGQPLMGTELDDVGFRGFSLRAFVWPTCPNWAKLVILLYPLGKEELSEAQPLHVHSAFPGLSLVSVTFPLGPPAREGNKIGLPFVPAILPGSPFEETPNFPPAKDLVAAVAALLRKTTYPEVKSNATYLRRRWGELLEGGNDPAALKSQALTLIWPLPTEPVSATQGRIAAFKLGSSFQP